VVELRQLEYLVLLAEEQHFGRAAARAHISRSAFSEHIARLEAALGAQLFERTTRSTRLTPAGEQAVEQCRAILGSIDRLVASTRAAARVGRELRVGLAAAQIEVTAEVLRRCGTDHPDLSLVVHQYDFGDPSAGLRSGESDVALLWGPLDTTGLLVVALSTDPIMVALPAAHPCAGAASLTRGDVIDEVWCDPPTADPVWRRFWLWEDVRRTPIRLGDVVRSPEGSVEIILAGRGIALVPSSIGRRLQIPGLRFVPVVDAPPCEVAVATPLHPSAEAHRFAQTAIEVAVRSNRR